MRVLPSNRLLNIALTSFARVKNSAYYTSTTTLMSNENSDNGADKIMQQQALQQLVGYDKKDRPRSLFLYDGPWGVWKFLVAFCCARDVTDHLRFCPIQTKVAKNIAAQYQNTPTDVSTAILMDETGGHVESTSVLRMFAFMGFPYNVLGPLALFLVPAFLRDFCYRVFARNRGEIWKQFRKVTGLGETQLEVYRDRIVGLEDEGDNKLDPGWGFESKKEEN